MKEIRRQALYLILRKRCYAFSAELRYFKFVKKRVASLVACFRTVYESIFCNKFVSNSKLSLIKSARLITRK